MKLIIDNITHSYGEIKFSYNTEIKNGIVGVFGHSGAGKTTLMNIISGIEMPDNGKIIFDDRELFNKDKKINIPVNKRNIGVVFQDNYLFPHLSVEKNLYYSKPYKKNNKKIISFDSVIELLDIGQLLKKKPFQLSGGERQRVAIGRTLLSKPELLLMDEPFSNLDKKRREQIISYLLKINNKFKIPMLIISHDLEDILKLTDTLLIIDNRSIAASGKYFDIVYSRMAPGIITAKNYLNIFELYHVNYLEEEDLHEFAINNDPANPIIKTNSESFSPLSVSRRKVRFNIHPDDITINTEIIKNTSIQNQIRCKVSNIILNENSAFITVDCGIKFVAEVTKTAVKKLNIEIGMKVYCLIKAKSLEVVHVY